MDFSLGRRVFKNPDRYLQGASACCFFPTKCWMTANRLERWFLLWGITTFNVRSFLVGRANHVEATLHIMLLNSRRHIIAITSFRRISASGSGVGGWSHSNLFKRQNQQSTSVPDQKAKDDGLAVPTAPSSHPSRTITFSISGRRLARGKGERCRADRRTKAKRSQISC